MMLSNAFALEVKNEDRARPINKSNIEDVVNFLKRTKIDRKNVVLVGYALNSCDGLRGKSVELKVATEMSYMGNIMLDGDRLHFCDEKLDYIRLGEDGRRFKVGNIICEIDVSFNQGNFCVCQIAAESEYKGLRLVPGSRFRRINSKELLYSPNSEYIDKKLDFKFEPKKAYIIEGNNKPKEYVDDGAHLPRCLDD